MEGKLKNILVTGGYGFIGVNFIRFVFEKTSFEGNIINIDKLTYAANPVSLKDIEKKYKSRYFFEKVDIKDRDKVKDIFYKYDIDTVIHFAAESHVDRSIKNPGDFVLTNVYGTFVLLDVAKNYWKNRNDVLFHHVSTDEVYGSLGETGYFFEDTKYDPRSPYSASKAGSDHLVKAYFHTFNLPVTISNCSNNYGPYQFPEKLIPLIILNMINEKKLPVYGDGSNIRDWLFVEDHCSGIWAIINNGKKGETYNIGGENEWRNIDLVNKLCEIMDEKYPSKNLKSYKELIKFVRDRPGHDKRYAINCDKIKNELNWSQSVDFEKGLEKTVDWYINNKQWIESIISGDYLNWIKENYGDR